MYGTTLAEIGEGTKVLDYIALLAAKRVRRELLITIDIGLHELRLVPAHKGAGNAGFQDLLALVREGLAWVKLSGTYRSTGVSATPYEDTWPFVAALIDASTHARRHRSRRQSGEWVGEPALRQAILADNPERLYGFERHLI